MENFPRKTRPEEQDFSKENEKTQRKALREFVKNSQGVKLDQVYSPDQLEFIFDMRFGPELITKLQSIFEFKADNQGNIIFTKRNIL